MIDLSIGVTRRARRGMLRECRLHALSVFSLAVAFVCLGAALLVVTNLKGLEDRWARAGRASVYLKSQASPEDVSALKDALARVPGVREVRYVSAGQAKTDFGAPGWGGPCPPAGDKPHRYVFTVHALKVDKLELPAEASASLVGFMVNANSIGKASFTAKYGRKK